ncbi:hypothetical protein [Thauera mechernichensis]
MDEHHSRFERLLVGLVLCVLVGLPLPLGSNRDWAIGIFVAVLGAIGLGCAIVRSRQRAPRAGNAAWRPGLPMVVALFNWRSSPELVLRPKARLRMALGVHEATDFNFQIPANAATFVMLCAIAVLAGHHTKRSRSRPSRVEEPPASGNAHRGLQTVWQSEMALAKSAAPRAKALLT